jgi:hypothetical protein
MPQTEWFSEQKFPSHGLEAGKSKGKMQAVLDSVEASPLCRRQPPLSVPSHSREREREREKALSLFLQRL